MNKKFCPGYGSTFWFCWGTYLPKLWASCPPPPRIVTNEKDNIADSVIIPCGITSVHDLVYITWHARLPKINKDPKIVTDRSTKNLNNDTLIKDLNELPFELIRASADNPLVKLEIFLS